MNFVNVWTIAQESRQYTLSVFLRNRLLVEMKYINTGTIKIFFTGFHSANFTARVDILGFSGPFALLSYSTPYFEIVPNQALPQRFKVPRTWETSVNGGSPKKNIVDFWFKNCWSLSIITFKQNTDYHFRSYGIFPTRQKCQYLEHLINPHDSPSAASSYRSDCINIHIKDTKTVTNTLRARSTQLTAA